MLNKAPIVKCSHCRKILALEEFDNHKCEMPLVGVKNIPVTNFLDTSVNGKKFMTGWGIDGILYTFEVVPRKPIPCVIPLSDEILHNQESDEDFTEPGNKNLKRVLKF